MKKYSRQLKFLSQFINHNEKLEDFQKKISKKNLIIVGCGGVGSVLAELLVRGGFLNLTLIDNDIIDETNISRQIFFQENIGELKTETLKKYLKKIDNKVNIKCFNNILDEKNINSIIDFKLNSPDLIIDATDNFRTRKIINFYCEEKKLDWIYSGAVKSELICCLFKGKDKLFSKVFPKEIIDESCCEYGVLASTTFTAGSLIFNQILKYFLKIDENKLIKINLWTNKIFEIKLKN